MLCGCAVDNTSKLSSTVFGDIIITEGASTSTNSKTTNTDAQVDISGQKTDASNDENIKASIKQNALNKAAKAVK